MAASHDQKFTVLVNGTVECAEIFEGGPLYVDLKAVKGRDWFYISPNGDQTNTSITAVVSQVSEKVPGPVPLYSWNTPFSLCFQSTNVFGWPQITMAMMSPESEALCYARTHIPMKRGKTVLKLPLFAPMYTAPQHQLFGSLFNKKPELHDPAWLCTGEHREVTAARQVRGYIQLSFDVSIGGLDAMGFDV